MHRLAVLVLVVATACPSSAPPPYATVEFRSSSARLAIDAEVARTSEQRAKGLMGRTQLGRGAGMLFLYPGASKWGGYWMKDTPIPLDIAFARDGVVTEIFTMQPCRADPCPFTTPAQAYDEAIEASAGLYSEAGISRGASVEARFRQNR